MFAGVEASSPDGGELLSVRLLGFVLKPSPGLEALHERGGRDPLGWPFTARMARENAAVGRPHD